MDGPHEDEVRELVAKIARLKQEVDSYGTNPIGGELFEGLREADEELLGRFRLPDSTIIENGRNGYRAAFWSIDPVGNTGAEAEVELRVGLGSSNACGGAPIFRSRLDAPSS